MRIAFTLLLGLALSPFAHSVSRVGNQSVGDLHDGFVSRVPVAYKKIENVGNEQVRLESYGAFIRNGRPLRSQIMVKSLRHAYPEHLQSNRDDFTRFYNNPGNRFTWEELDHSNSCVMVYVGMTKDIIIGNAAWGRGKGVTFIARRDGLAGNIVKQLLRGIVLSSRACAW